MKGAATNKKRHGEDFYKRIGAMGGKTGKCGGFNDRELAKRAGVIGGKRGKRGYKIVHEDEDGITYKNKEGKILRVAKDAR